MASWTQLRPLNMYGYSKHLFDLHAKRAGFLNRMVGLKYFNVFGPNEGHKGDMRSLVHKSTAQVQAEGVIRLFKSYRSDFRDGEQKRDFLYVKDAVAMTLASGRQQKGRRPFQHRLRQGADMAGPGARGFCRVETQAED